MGAKDVYLRCRCCGRLFLSYRGAQETRNGNTCISCWSKDSPPVFVKYGDDLLNAAPIPEAAEEPFPEEEPGSLFPLADALLHKEAGGDER